MINVRGIYKDYGKSKECILKNISFSIKKGEYVALTGRSGSGKSTLMNILGCLDRQDCGEYYLNGNAVQSLSTERLAQVRSQTIGFVFQSFHLVPYLSALENVELPLYYTNCAKRQRIQKATQLLEHMGLGERLHYKPSQLSGGQQQRVAIARALINNPPLILADEPTGNLDSAVGDEVLELFRWMNREGTTILLVTHDAQVAHQAQRILRLKDGCLEDAV